MTNIITAEAGARESGERGRRGGDPECSLINDTTILNDFIDTQHDKHNTHLAIPKAMLEGRADS